MAKQPVPGRVKTRLCPPLAPAEAAELAQAMLEDTVEKCLACAEFETTLAVDGELAWFRERFPRVGSIVAQEGAGLGARLAHQFEREAREWPGSSVVIVGADSPQVPVERIVSAHASIESGADLVLGPDRGGGYYLVALRRPVAELFTRVVMSTPTMREETIELARTLGLAVELLEVDFDVDRPEDLALLASLRRPERSARVLARLAPKLSAIVR
jgi:rSAM/selenodomain-associated transferase 1